MSKRVVWIGALGGALSCVCALGCGPMTNTAGDGQTAADAAVDSQANQDGSGDGRSGAVRWQEVLGVASPFVGRWGYAVADRGDGMSLVFFGTNLDAAASGMAFDDVFVVDARTNPPVIRSLDAVGGPGARWCGCAAWDSRRGDAVVFGGRSSTGATTPETWTFNFANRRWTPARVSGGPQFVIGCSMTYVPDRDEFVFFGGSNGAGVTNETWRFSPGTDTWSAVTATPSPSARYDAELRYVAATGTLVMFGGGRPGVFPNDVWRFDPATNAWSEIAVQGARPRGRRTPWLLLDRDGSGFVAGYGSTTLQGSEPLDDLWRFDFATSRWTDIRPPIAEIPGPRGFAIAVPATGDSLGLLIGGFDGLSPIAEVWRLYR